MKPILIHHRSTHHAQNSGYGRIVDYVKAEQIPKGQNVIPYILAKFIGDHSNQNSGIYDSNSVQKDFTLFQTLITSRKKHYLVHYLNAERDIRHVVKHKNLFKNTLFCGTFHKTPEILLKTIKDPRYLKHLDGVIAIGAHQVDFLKNWLNTDMVNYIPHGVDSNFFVPDYKKRNDNTMLFVGQHLRDFETFNACIPLVTEKIKDLKVNVIIRKDFKSYIKPHKSIQIYSGLSDLELKSHYQKARLLFLPLLNVTACNSILEAMACGLPIITTDVGSNPGYLFGTENVLAPIKNKDFLSDAIIKMLQNEELCLKIGETSRNKALEYDWKIIANRIQNFYNWLTEKKID